MEILEPQGVIDPNFEPPSERDPGPLAENTTLAPTYGGRGCMARAALVTTPPLGRSI
jgi:hypothetical protein